MDKEVIIEETRIGDIIVAKIQVRENAQKSVRPVIVMKKDKGNGHERSLIVLPLTTCLKNAFLPGRVFLPTEGSGLPFDTLVACDRPVAVSQEDIGKHVSSLTDAYFSVVCKEALWIMPFDRFFG